MKKLQQLLDSDRISFLTVPFFKILGYCVLLLEVVLWTMAYELLLFELIPDLFKNNFLVDLLTTTVGCGLLLGTVRSLYGAFKVKNYASVLNPAGQAKKNDDQKKNDITKLKRYCNRCKIDKGDSYSHCSICNQCVFEMDHHCFFLANCVGGKNYKFFLSYAVYAALNSMIHFMFYIPYIPDLVYFRLRVFKKVGIIKLAICSAMAIMAMFFTLFLIGSHIYYMINSTSYLKNKFGKNKEEYDWKRFLFWYFKCGKGDDEISSSYKKGYEKVFGSTSPFKALWPDF